MSDTQKDPSTATPPAASGGLTKAEVQALLSEALGPVGQAIKSLTESHKTQADVIARIGPGIKADDVAKLVTEQLTAHQKAAAEASAKTATRTALRDKVIAAKLPGVPKELLASLPDTEDETALTTAAEGLRKHLDSLGVKLADVGGAAKDGGKGPAADAAAPKYTAASTGLSEGMAKYASSIELPK